MITQKLKALVQEEANNIMKFATKEDIGRLSIESLHPARKDRCIYGLLTGNCNSKRAIELLNQCAIPFVGYTGFGGIRFEEKINPVHKTFATSGHRCFSPIEFYIGQKGANNAELLAYIKGERRELGI